ncbi:hypothetical protein D9757_008921 [Collybiopsis confluens]|uniref:Uncharacterized protein n=1 Tax=Collybiopsis confluens TaxID=2823264 RepID=A0A8H5HFK1_9AGAR|nr:hypothetical protein D9757_008921 [Collybiopsis confluens]
MDEPTFDNGDWTLNLLVGLAAFSLRRRKPMLELPSSALMLSRFFPLVISDARPALSVSLNKDVDTNKELMAHGYSNILAGAVSTVPIDGAFHRFYRVGGGTRTAGFLLAAATTVLLLVGTGPIGYIRKDFHRDFPSSIDAEDLFDVAVPVVGALIFVLGIDLMKEALWDTRHRVSKMEYITIVSIIVVMTVWDFVVRRSIRAFLTGETAISTVRRPSAQRAYLKEVSKQTTILRLQGFLFFGTITYVEEAIRGIINSPSWQKNPVRFLVVDLTLVAGLNMSAAEAFVRIQRLLSAKQVTLVFCGFEVESAVGKALESVGVMGAWGVELFSTFNDAMEWTKNAYLTAYFRSQKVETSSSVIFGRFYAVSYRSHWLNESLVLPGRQDVDVISSYQSPSAVGSPRRALLLDIGARTIANDIRPSPLLNDPNTEPLKTSVRAFSSFGDIDYNQLGLLIPYLQRMSIPNDFILWRQGNISDGLYLIESGVLRATYHFAEHTQSMEESMVPGSLAGELSALLSLPRNAMVIAERAAVLWKLSIENLRLMETEEPLAARAFTQMVLKSILDQIAGSPVVPHSLTGFIEDQEGAFEFQIDHETSTRMDNPEDFHNPTSIRYSGNFFAGARQFTIEDGVFMNASEGVREDHVNDHSERSNYSNASHSDYSQSTSTSTHIHGRYGNAREREHPNSNKFRPPAPPGGIPGHDNQQRIILQHSAGSYGPDRRSNNNGWGIRKTIVRGIPGLWSRLTIRMAAAHIRAALDILFQLGPKWTPSTFTPHSFGAFDSTIQVEPRSFTATGDPVARGEPSEAGLQQSAKPGVASSVGQFRSGLSLLLHSFSHSSHPTDSSTLDPPQPSRASSQSSVSTITPASSLESFPKDHSGSPMPTSTRTGSPYPALIPPPHPPIHPQIWGHHRAIPVPCFRHASREYDGILRLMPPNIDVAILKV